MFRISPLLLLLSVLVGCNDPYNGKTIEITTDGVLGCQDISNRKRLLDSADIAAEHALAEQRGEASYSETQELASKAKKSYELIEEMKSKGLAQLLDANLKATVVGSQPYTSPGGFQWTLLKLDNELWIAYPGEAGMATHAGIKIIED